MARPLVPSSPPPPPPPLLLLLLVIIASCAADEEEVLPSSSEAGGGGGGPLDDDGDPVCDIDFDPCAGSCWRSGRCMSCCRDNGFVHGRCSLKRGDACYCCHSPDQKREEQQQQQQLASPEMMISVNKT